MPAAVPPHLQPSSQAIPSRVWRILSIVAAAAAVVLSLVVFGAKLKQFEVSPLLLLALLLAICIVIFVHGRFLLHLHRQHRDTTGALQTSEQDFQQMADNIEEIFWVMDTQTKQMLLVNRAYETVARRSRESLRQSPSSYVDTIHPEDRAHIVARIDEATKTGNFAERFRIKWPTGEVRWVSVKGFPVHDANGKISRLVGTAQDITAQKEAEEQVATNLALAQGAWAESEALRKATLALTQDLRMDFVLDALLQSLTKLISFECARIWLLEGETRLFVAREKLQSGTAGTTDDYPLTLDAANVPFLYRVLLNQKNILLSDTRHESDWKTFQHHAHLRSWLCVPLVAADRTLGLLSAGHSQPNSFTSEDLRRAELLAIPAAVAIQNSRLYECAFIYGSELEKRVSDLHEARKDLEEAQAGRKASEDKFQKLFFASPVAFSVTTLNDGRFMDANAAFESRYGYTRAELIGHTVRELQLWEDAKDRSLMLTQLKKGPVRNVITRLRTKSGELKLTAYSADKVRFEGLDCILAVSEDVPQCEQPQSN